MNAGSLEVESVAALFIEKAGSFLDRQSERGWKYDISLSASTERSFNLDESVPAPSMMQTPASQERAMQRTGIPPRYLFEHEALDPPWGAWMRGHDPVVRDQITVRLL